MKTVLKSHKIMMVALLLITMLCISTKSFARLVIFSPREDDKIRVEIISSAKKMYEGNKAQFKARVLPDTEVNKNIQWESSNKKIATVDQDGVVTAKKAGIVKITAKFTQKKSKKASCTVTILKNVKANKVDLDIKSRTLKKGQTFKLTATIGPKNTTFRTVDIKTNNDVVSIDKEKATMDSKGRISVVVTAKKSGVAKITVSKDGKKAECIVAAGTYDLTLEGKGKFKLAVDKDKLNRVIGLIESKKMCQGFYSDGTGLRGYCNLVAAYHRALLIGEIKESEAQSTQNAVSTVLSVGRTKWNSLGSYTCGYDFSSLKKQLDAHNPVVLHVANGSSATHWVTVVGYKGNCEKFDDLLILGSYSGKLIVGKGEWDNKRKVFMGETNVGLHSDRVMKY